MRCYAEHCIATASRPSVRLSVTLRYHGYIGWNASKIISWLIILGLVGSLSLQTSTSWIYTPRGKSLNSSWNKAYPLCCSSITLLCHCVLLRCFSGVKKQISDTFCSFFIYLLNARCCVAVQWGHRVNRLANIKSHWEVLSILQVGRLVVAVLVSHLLFKLVSCTSALFCLMLYFYVRLMVVFIFLWFQVAAVFIL